MGDVGLPVSKVTVGPGNHHNKHHQVDHARQRGHTHKQVLYKAQETQSFKMSRFFQIFRVMSVLIYKIGTTFLPCHIIGRDVINGYSHSFSK